MLERCAGLVFGFLFRDGRASRLHDEVLAAGLAQGYDWFWLHLALIVTFPVLVAVFVRASARKMSARLSAAPPMAKVPIRRKPRRLIPSQNPLLFGPKIVSIVNGAARKTQVA